MQKLPLSFYQNTNVLTLSYQLLGKYLFTQFEGALTGGIIVETEAYRAPEDRASHAYGMRRTKRNEVMYQAGGVCYVYTCYGIYPLFNVVTHQKDIPHAILIRALEPTEGLEEMMRRRRQTQIKRNLTAGPGALAQALGILPQHNGWNLTNSLIWIEDRGLIIAPKDIIASPRVGVAYAGEDAQLPWRFRIKDNKWTSPAK